MSHSLYLPAQIQQDLDYKGVLYLQHRQQTYLNTYWYKNLKIWRPLLFVTEPVSCSLLLYKEEKLLLYIYIYQEREIQEVNWGLPSCVTVGKTTIDIFSAIKISSPRSTCTLHIKLHPQAQNKQIQNEYDQLCCTYVGHCPLSKQIIFNLHELQ